jgi:hypothetical protein
MSDNVAAPDASPEPYPLAIPLDTRFYAFESTALGVLFASYRNNSEEFQTAEKRFLFGRPERQQVHWVNL